VVTRLSVAGSPAAGYLQQLFLVFLFRQANALMVPVSQQPLMTCAGATTLFGHAADDVTLTLVQKQILKKQLAKSHRLPLLLILNLIQIR
jgi:hypothetical protein